MIAAIEKTQETRKKSEGQIADINSDIANLEEFYTNVAQEVKQNKMMVKQSTSAYAALQEKLCAKAKSLNEITQECTVVDNEVRNLKDKQTDL